MWSLSLSLSLAMEHGGPVTECVSVLRYNLYLISCLMFSFCSHFSSEILTFCLQNFGNSKSCSLLGCHFIKHINVKERTQTTSISTTQGKSRVGFFSESAPLVQFFLIFLSENILQENIYHNLLAYVYPGNCTQKQSEYYTVHGNLQFKTDHSPSPPVCRSVWRFKRKIANQEIIKFWYSSSSSYYQVPSALRPV